MIITLTTDFGLYDHFVGVMKGVMLSIAPSARLIDITHDITPYNVRMASFVLNSSYNYFPEKSVHLCVVDPGVGSERRALAGSAGGRFFVGPDNGLFTSIIDNYGPAKIHEITDSKMKLARVSGTFHGRDIFAPVAAHLASGTPLESVGPVVNDPVRLEMAGARRLDNGSVAGEIVYMDRFGNAVTNIGVHMIKDSGVSIRVAGETVKGIVPSYFAGVDSKLNATFGSDDTLELFVRNGDAARKYGLIAGDKVFCESGVCRT